MNPSRRTFLKTLGLSLAGLAVKPAPGSLAAPAPSPFAPRPGALAGRRWAMAVDFRKCSGDCRDCIQACHDAHNVPDFGNPKDEIKWIWNEPLRAVFPGLDHSRLDPGLRAKPVPVLCNHCANPPCVRVCPTQATFRRKEDGIVVMDYHRCIGCRFCIAGCPYGARSMNYRDPRPFVKRVNPQFPTRTKGVVEKCNFCEERLARGQGPACVEACKEKALVFGDLDNAQSEIRQLVRTRITLRRRPELGTQPQVYYLL